MLDLTERARVRLETYLDQARRALRGHPGVDGEEVTRGLREHVEVELAGRPSGAAPVTAAELDAVLERLGPPESLVGAAGPGAGPTLPSPGALTGRLFRLVSGGLLTAGALVFLLAPGALVWGQSQIGGVLDAARNPGAPPIPGTRSPAYWLWVAEVVACVTGLWWTATGAALARWSGEMREFLDPLPFAVESRHGRRLAAVGAALAAASVVALVL